MAKTAGWSGGRRACSSEPNFSNTSCLGEPSTPPNEGAPLLLEHLVTPPRFDFYQRDAACHARQSDVLVSRDVTALKKSPHSKPHHLFREFLSQDKGCHELQGRFISGSLHVLERGLGSNPGPVASP